MKTRAGLLIILLISMAVLLNLTGCSYFNTYYNIRKQFRDAEHDYNQRQNPTPQQGGPSGQPRQGGSPPQQQSQNVPSDKYRKVLETGAKLLEFYPKSRWLDDTLLLMGISYFRLQDYSRADRKFTELLTNFPKSNLAPEAVIWKARTLVEQGKHADATTLLTEQATTVKDRRQRGHVEALLADIEFDQKHWDDAATHFKTAIDLLPVSEDKFDAIYKYGVCEFELKQYKDAADAFAEVGRSTRIHQRAFEAHVFSSRAALASGDKERAEQILRRLKGNSAFEDFQGDLDLELANLAVESGRVDEGIEFYQKYLDEHPTSDKRSLAFFRLAKVYRSHRVDLQQAKSLLDSAMRSGGTREITDSARAAHEETSQGLQVLTQFKTLGDTIARLEVERDSLKRLPTGVEPPAVHPVVTPDSLHGDTLSSSVDSAAIPGREKSQAPAVSPVPSTPDSTLLPVPRDSAKVASGAPARTGEADPAALDSTRLAVLRDSARVDSGVPAKTGEASPVVPDSTQRSMQRDSTHGASDIPAASAGAGATAHDSTSIAPPKPKDALAEVEGRLSRAQALHQLAALRVAEFYEFILQEPESSMAYYQIAAATPFNKDVYWKANLYLAERNSQDSTKTADTRRYFEAVAKADSVPASAANIARQALGLPLLEVSHSPQDSAFRVAEDASLGNQVPPDSVVQLYGRAAAYDSTNLTGMHALFAQMYIYENELNKGDSAAVIAERLISFFPDSAFISHLRNIVLPPDTTASVFNLSDEQLSKSTQPKSADIEEKPTEGGWPPPEESLKGRRFD